MNFDFIIKEACNIVAKEGPKVIEKAVKNTPKMAAHMKDVNIVYIATGIVIAAGGTLIDAAIKVYYE